MVVRLPKGYMPSDDEPFMNKRQREYFRRKLEKWKEDILVENRETLQHLHRAVDEGTYGYCEETGEPISLKRLDARPIATLSIEAQERHERREKVYRDD